MKCKVCGGESGKYSFCKKCYSKRSQKLTRKCVYCGEIHDKNTACPITSDFPAVQFRYEAKETLLTKNEQSFFEVLRVSLPENYYVFPQVNLAAFIQKTDGSYYHNELFRNVDFLITDREFTPKIALEINDRSHLSKDRRKRDEKVENILEEAGIPLMKLWTTYGVNSEYIKKKVETLLEMPVTRKHHFEEKPLQEPNIVRNESPSQQKKKTVANQKQGCYIATCVYGSYDCPQVWILRRFRDDRLSSSRLGRFLIKVYYKTSPIIVKCFGNTHFFHYFWKKILDKFVLRLKANGYKDISYKDSCF